MTISPAPHHEHTVQFYEEDGFLARVVADFLADGLAAAQPAVVIATEDHRSSVSALLSARGLDSHSVQFLDAAETLATFMDGALPNAERFRATIGGVLRSVSAARPEVPIRAYGEMVDLLWRDGNREGAIRLEQLWNDLASEHRFSLLCAYAMGNFSRASHAEAFARICDTHTLVMPTEAVPLRDADALAREVAALQQRAAALEHEVARSHKLEQALRARERELRDFVDHATVGMHWVGPDGTILWANAAELRLLGYKPQEYIGRNIAAFHADRATIDDILRRLGRNEEIRDYEARLVAKDGSIRHVAINSNVLFVDGKFVHTRCFTRDITDRKRLEEANEFLLEATRVLHRSLDYDTRVEEIRNLLVPRFADSVTIEIVEDGDPAPAERGSIDGHTMTVPMRINDMVLGTLTLRSADRRYTDHDLDVVTELSSRGAIAIDNARLYRLMQQINRTKDEFLATISHELRTPLTAILGWAKMLSLGGLDVETVSAAYETIERSARAQSALIDDLLDLSRVRTGKLTMQKELVELNGVVKNAVQTQRLAAEAKRIQLDVTLKGDGAIVVGDPTRLQQITWNLVSNAIKFSDAGSKVAVTLDCADDAARITVSDTGKGIDRDFLPHVFEPFRQADGANTRAHGGLGLGLAIVKYLSEQHGGTVEAKSPGPGAGATFVVTLPLARARGAQPAIGRDVRARDQAEGIRA